MDAEKHREFSLRMVRHQNRVFRYVVSLVPNRADAEELFQQTCLTLWEGWERYDPALDFVPWACGIAHNHVRNFLRKRERGQILLDPEVVEQLRQRSLARRERQEDELQDLLRGCLDRLPADRRSVIEGYYRGRDVQDLARQRGSSPEAVYKLLRRVREVLQECMSRQHAAGATS